MTPDSAQSERLEGAWSPDVLVKLECLRHGQHSAISRIEMKCQLCHDANRPGVIERRYVDEEQVDEAVRYQDLRAAVLHVLAVGQIGKQSRQRLKDALGDAAPAAVTESDVAPQSCPACYCNPCQCRPIIGNCSECGDAREDEYTCRGGGHTVLKGSADA